MPRKRDLLLFCIVWLVGFLLLANLYRYVDEQRHYESPNFNLFKTERLISLGVFELTAYCPCGLCCGVKSVEDYGRTSSDVMALEGSTIATDNSIIPIGTKVSLGKYGVFTAQDKGGAIKGNRIDIFFNSHQAALNFGKQEVTVYLILER